MIAMNNSIEIKSSWMIFINYYKTIPDWLSFANRSITATRQVRLGDSLVRLVIRYESEVRIYPKKVLNFPLSVIS